MDVVGQVDLTAWLALAAQGDLGWEPNRFGTAWWAAGAAYVRAKPLSWLWLSARGDRFHERAPGASAPVFWAGSDWVSSGTLTIDLRPHDNLSVRVEGRHDVAEAPLYFRGLVAGDGSATAPYVPNATSQSTLTLGATAWF